MGGRELVDVINLSNAGAVLGASDNPTVVYYTSTIPLDFSHCGAVNIL